MKTEKWFYPIQRIALENLHREYQQITCLYQDLKDNRVYECYECYVSESDNVPKIIMIVLNKQSRRYSMFICIEK